MKPAKFDYHAPRALHEALEIIDRHAGEARVLAGGQSLIPMLNLRLLSPAALIDLNHIAELAYIEEEKGMIKIGGMTRQRKLEFSSLAHRSIPLVSEALRSVGHLPTRARGTIGGSIAHADPAAELPMLLVLLEGEVVAKRASGERRIRAEELFQSYFTTSLAPEEILTEVRIPALPKGAGFGLEEFARRHGDFAVVSVAVLLCREGNRCTRARIATGGTGPVPSRLRAVEQILEREGLGEDAIESAAQKAGELVQPASDPSASADYRRHLTRVLTARALRKAVGLAG